MPLYPEVSLRKLCRAVQVSRTLVQYQTIKREDETILEQEIMGLATKYGRYGYRRITSMLVLQGYCINHKKVYRIWRELGLKVPKKHRKRGRLWDNNGSCVRLRPEHRNHVWAYDFVSDRLSNGRPIRWFNVIDEHTRECLACVPQRKFTHKDIQAVLADLFITKGIPDYVRSDNGPEFIAKDLKNWFRKIGINILFIEPGSPWENGYCESFNGKMRDEFLNMERFDNWFEVETLTKMWVKHYNTVRPHSALKGKPPAPQTILVA